MKQYAQQPYRFVNISVFLVSCLANSFIAQSLSTISLQIEKYFQVPLLQVNMCALVFMIIHPLMTFYANYVLNKYGLKVGKCTINAVCVILGVVIRIFVYVNFAFVLAGNIFVAFGNVFLMNASTLFSVTWFRPEMRLVITSLSVFTTMISGGLGALLSPFIVKEVLTPEQGRQAVFHLMIYQAILVGGAMILNLVLFRGRPAVPPTPANNIQRTQYCDGIRKLMSNKSYVLLFLQMMLIFGSTNSFAVSIQAFLAPFGFGSKVAGLGLAITVGSGLFGCVLSSLIIKKTKKFKLVITVEIIVGMLWCMLLVVPLVKHITPLLWICIAGIGMFVYPIIPGNIELGCEVVFPVGEALSTGFLLAGGQLFGFILGVGQSFIIKGKSQISSIIGGSIYMVCFMVGLVLFIFTKVQLKRQEYEKKYKLQLMDVERQLF